MFTQRLNLVSLTWSSLDPRSHVIDEQPQEVGTGHSVWHPCNDLICYCAELYTTLFYTALFPNSTAKPELHSVERATSV